MEWRLFVKKRISVLVAALLLTLMMTVSALAAGPTFADVPTDASYGESVAYLAEQGITSGTGNNCFSPDAPITVRQWAVLLCRAYELEVNGENWQELSGNCVNATYQKCWLGMNAVMMPDTQMSRSALLESAFAAADVPVYDSILYPEGEALSTADNLLRIGKELRLCGEADAAYKIVTRGEAAMLLHAILTRTFTVEAPAAPVTLVNAAGVNVNSFLLELRKFPKQLLDAFNAAGWTYRIDFDYMGELSNQLNMSCIGATNYSRKTIYISEASATLHEFGHFLDGQMSFPTEHERLYLAEAQNSGLRDYAKTNAREYFADCFAYYITYGGNSEMMERLRKNAPQTCAYFEELGKGGWSK